MSHTPTQWAVFTLTESETMGYFFKRLSEPSTWAGLAVLAGSAANAWATKDPAAIASCLGAAAAIIAPEKQSKPAA